MSRVVMAAADPFTNYVDWRYHPQNMQVRDIEGLRERIVDGKLHLRLREFLELVLSSTLSISKLVA